MFLLISVNLLLVSLLNCQIYKYDSLNRISQIINFNGSTSYLQYDQNGNNIQILVSSSSICPLSKSTLIAELSSQTHTYQWQWDTGVGFVNIVSNSNYSGTASNVLTLNNPSTQWYGYKFRCAITNGSTTTYSKTDTLRFVSTWYGGRDSAWENPANWGCNKVPDQYTDVELYGNAVYLPVVSSNQAVRSLKGFDKSSLKIKAGYKLKLGIETINVESVTIGTQIWTKKNLDVSTYRNGDTIPQATDHNQWINLTTGAWCYYNNDPANGGIFGKLYNAYAVLDPRGLAPEGWHIPNNSEWGVLVTFLGDIYIAGGKMKADTTWNAPNLGATNVSGFTALASGSREGQGLNFIRKGDFSMWWTTSENLPTGNDCRYLIYSGARIYNNPSPKFYGYAVRCIKN